MSSYSEGQTHQLMEALEAHNFSADDVTKLGQYDRLLAIREVVNNRARIVPIEFQPILRLISGEHNLIIPATDGSALISQAEDVFNGWIDPDFVNWGANETSSATPDTPVQVCELARDAIFAQMLDSICADLERICLAQSQIIGFVRKYADWLHPRGWATFFPFSSKGKFFVALVRTGDDGRLLVRVSRRERGDIWSAESRARIVLPQLRF